MRTVCGCNSGEARLEGRRCNIKEDFMNLSGKRTENDILFAEIVFLRLFLQIYLSLPRTGSLFLGSFFDFIGKSENKG